MSGSRRSPSIQSARSVRRAAARPTGDRSRTTRARSRRRAPLPCLRHINGLTAYGWASGENGVARLVSDIFHEVDEEVRREQLKKLWDRYGNYVAAAAVLLVLAVAAWRAYMWWEAKKAAET